MKIERLRNGRYKLIFLCGFILVVVLLVSVVFKGSKAKYRNTQVIPFVKGYITAKKSDFTTMGIYLEDANGGEEKNGKKYTKQGDNYILPSDGYVINETNSYCEKYDASQDKSIKVETARLYTDILGNHSIKGVNKGSKCYIYLDKGNNQRINIRYFLLSMWGYEDTSTITERTDFNTIRLDGGNKVYKANDNDGTSYYLVGNPQNNWVKFADYYWRIVRINGNGSLRLIYQGASANKSGSGTLIKNSAYNINNSSAEHVGYMWTVGQQRGYGTSSTIKGVVDSFYSSKLTSFASYIDKNAGFCNDRSVVPTSDFPGTTGTGILNTSFGARDRLFTNKAPILICPSNDDLFTASGATKGNKKLTYPIGLITADELAMGGLVFREIPSAKNVNMYDTGVIYWTMTPYNFFTDINTSFSYLYYVWTDGKLVGNHATFDGPGVRPVINLIKDITFSKGDGTSTNPFEI